MNILFILLLIDIFDPFFDAAQVHGDTAAGAGPNIVFSLDIFRADNAAYIRMATLSLNEPGRNS